MAAKPQCPFCRREFATVDQLTKHLIYDKCRVSALKGGKSGKKPVK